MSPSTPPSPPPPPSPSPPPPSPSPPPPSPSPPPPSPPPPSPSPSQPSPSPPPPSPSSPPPSPSPPPPSPPCKDKVNSCKQMKTVVACSEIQNICAVSCGVCIPLSPSPPPPSLPPPPSPSPPPPSPSRCTGSNTFADKASLKTAVTEYNSNAAAATAKYGPIAGWCVSRVTDMGKLFFGMYHFNEDISSWDTSRFTNMHAMFWSGFNHPLSFDTSRVTDMSHMFAANQWFNQPLHLDTSRVTNMADMFHAASTFNQPLSFDTSRVTNMRRMFWDAKKFSQQLRFDLSSVPNTGEMFHVCTPPCPAPPICAAARTLLLHAARTPRSRWCIPAGGGSCTRSLRPRRFHALVFRIGRGPRVVGSSENRNRQDVPIATLCIGMQEAEHSSTSQWGIRPRNATSKRSASSGKVLGYMWDWGYGYVGVMSRL